MKTTILAAILLGATVTTMADDRPSLEDQLRESQREADLRSERQHEDYERRQSLRLQREQVELLRQQLQQERFEDLDLNGRRY